MAFALSPRLRRILFFVRRGEPLWDIGCDHGALGVQAILRDVVPHATLVDHAQGAITRVQQALPVTVDRDRLRLLAMDVLTLPPQPVAGTVVCAGIGGAKIETILDRFVLPHRTVDLRLVLEAHGRREGMLRRVLADGYRKIAEETIQEGRRDRVIAVFDPAP